MKKACLLLLLVSSFYSYTTSDFKLRYTAPIECEDVLADQQYTPEGFIASTHVKTLDGYKQIEALNVGDTIIGFDHIDGLQPQQISNITKTTIEYCIKIVINHEIIYAAPCQKFYLLEHDAWVEAQDLMPGDILSSIQMQGKAPIESIERVSGSYDIYSITVDRHTFFVTPSDIFVHNANALNILVTNIGPLVECASTIVHIGQMVVKHPVLEIIGYAVDLANGCIVLEKMRSVYVPKTTPISERACFERMRSDLCKLHADFLQLKEGLEKFITRGQPYEFSFTNVLISSLKYTLPVSSLHVTVAQERQYTEEQKANLSKMRQAELDYIEDQIIQIQMSLAFHINELIYLRNSELEELYAVSAKNDKFVGTWNANLFNVSRETALSLYETTLTQQSILEGLKSKNCELRVAIAYYNEVQQPTILQRTTNLETIIRQEETNIRNVKQFVESHYSHRNQKVVENYLTKLRVNVASIRSNFFSKEKEYRQKKNLQKSEEAKRRKEGLEPKKKNRSPKDKDPLREKEEIKFLEEIKNNADEISRTNRFGMLYRDAKTKLWWSVDKARHAGYKVFKEVSKGLKCTFETDEIGNVVLKHKSDVGKFIPKSEIIRVK